METMKRYRSAVAAAIAIAVLLLGSIAAQARELGHDGSLTADIPQPKAWFQGQAPIHEGGLHFSYVDTSETEALGLLFRYRILLETSDWTVHSVVGGGNPFGSPGGAQLTADHEDGRHLRANAGHPGVQHLDHAPSASTFLDACVWPQVPADDQCNPQRWISEDARTAVDGAEVGATGGLTAGVPEPALAEYRGDDVIPEGGRHFSYISAATHFGAFTGYMRALDEAGWTINGSMTHGDQARGGGVANATDGARHLHFSVGGTGLLTFFDACVWPQEPVEARCPRSGTD